MVNTKARVQGLVDYAKMPPSRQKFLKSKFLPCLSNSKRKYACSTPSLADVLEKRKEIIQKEKREELNNRSSLMMTEDEYDSDDSSVNDSMDFGY